MERANGREHEKGIYQQQQKAQEMTTWSNTHTSIDFVTVLWVSYSVSDALGAFGTN